MNTVFGVKNHDWLFDYFDERPKEDQERFLQQALKRMLHAQTPVDAALKLIQSEEQRQELIQRLQQMNTPATGTSQAALTA